MADVDLIKLGINWRQEKMQPVDKVPTTNLGYGVADATTVLWGDQTWRPLGGVGASGFSGFSGFSGSSGYSGYSGYSGLGLSGYSGVSGYSGFSGNSGFSGGSGFSGFSGESGFSGIGTSGFSGFSGYSGDSGFSGFSGLGTSGLVFPFNEDAFVIDPIEIPKYWPRIIGIDFGSDHPFGAAELA